ncbi:MAG: class I SAM-dependent methyltransferase [Solirubrobacterales bacterium]
MADKVYLDNDEATEAWNGVLFDRFTEFRDVVVRGLAAFGSDAMGHDPPHSGDHVIDLGCGFGDTTQALAQIVGPDGSAVGVDVAERFIEQSRLEADGSGVENVSFEVTDVEREVPGGPYDYAFSRMGTMFFANPGAAMRNVHAALKPGGKLNMVVWRKKIENEWFFRSEQVVNRFVDEPDPDDSDEPTCGPGPFSMGNADTASGILYGAGFVDIALRRIDMPLLVGRDLDEAVAFGIALGPAAEVIRLAGDDADEMRPQIEADLRELASEYLSPAGVVTPASCWAVTATA